MRGKRKMEGYNAEKEEKRRGKETRGKKRSKRKREGHEREKRRKEEGKKVKDTRLKKGEKGRV